MKKLLISFILIAAPLLAQSITVNSKTEVLGSGDAYFPKFSPDGSKIFFTHSGYKGLEYIDLSSNSVEKLSEEYGAGYEFCFSPDGSEVFYRSDVYKGLKKYSSLVSQKIATKESRIIESEKRNLSIAQTLSSGTLYYQYDRNFKSMEISKSLRKSSTNDAALLNENGTMILVKNGSKKAIEPFGEGIYIWPSLSPDGTKILFTFSSKGTFICDLDGNILVSLGKRVDAPQWSPDGKWIVYMEDYDNGSNFTKSDLFAVTADGITKADLSYGEDEIEMYPQWSADGSKIVYHTDNGKLMMLNLTIAE